MILVTKLFIKFYFTIALSAAKKYFGCSLPKNKCQIDNEGWYSEISVGNTYVNQNFNSYFLKILFEKLFQILSFIAIALIFVHLKYPGY